MNSPKVIIIMPAYYAEKTVGEVWKKIPKKFKKNTILIDDHSSDKTYETAKQLGIETYQNSKNLGYGGNLKVCLQKALEKNADIVIEMHPDNEYDPSAIDVALQKVNEKTGMVLGNRFYQNPKPQGMYIWKYIPSKFLTALDNSILATHVSDLHQGFRLYTKLFLERANFTNNSNTYLFSFEVIAQARFYGFDVQEVPVTASYTGKKRGASLRSSIIYSFGTFMVLFLYIMAKLGIKSSLFS